MHWQVIQENFKGKKVLVTGDTGFKGTWLTLFLNVLGAETAGLSIDMSYQKERFTKHGYFADIRDLNEVKTVLEIVRPDIVFHLAAQSVILNAIDNPTGTFSTNTMGSVNLLEAIRLSGRPCSVVMITSDKAYRNHSWVWGYRENDVLGGNDPYSASKAMAELAITAYCKSYFPEGSTIRVASCRAGNVLGGGDRNPYRIIPDCIRHWEKQMTLEIRNPTHVRPWNYVADVIWGYLLVANALLEGKFHGESFNFGPETQNSLPVKALVELLWMHWPNKKFEPYRFSANISHNGIEDAILRLNSDKAQTLLSWKPLYTLNEALKQTACWYAESQTRPARDLYLTAIQSYLSGLQ